MKRFYLVFWLLLFAVFCVSGCVTKTTGTYNSTDTPTSNIYASFDVTRDLSGNICASANLLYKDLLGNDIRLTGTETITCNGVPLALDYGFGTVTYDAIVPPSSQYLFRFTRANNEVIDSIVPSVPITRPTITAIPDVITEGQTFTITWDPSTEPGISFNFSINSPAIADYVFPLSDIGSCTIQPSNLTIKSPLQPGLYSFTVSMMRYRTNPYNHAYHDGTCRAYLADMKSVKFQKL